MTSNLIPKSLVRAAPIYMSETAALDSRLGRRVDLPKRELKQRYPAVMSPSYEQGCLIHPRAASYTHVNVQWER
jgi:hypothetical protein